MASLRPAYLIHGDDHGRIAERRARLRRLAIERSGEEGLEVLEGDAATPEAVATALSAMTLTAGRRFVIVDGAERFKEKEIEPLVAALGALGDDTTVAFFAREDSRQTVPDALAEAVRRAGGDVAAERQVRPWELPKWVSARARELGLELESGAARALVDHVGERQQRLVRELEKLLLGLGGGAHVGLEQVEELTASSAERRAWSLADAIVARDGGAAVRLYLALRDQGESLVGLLYAVAGRLRTALDVATRLDDGEPPAAVRRGLRMPRKAADRLVADVQRSDPAALRGAIATFADLDVDSRGGGALDADTAALLAIVEATTG